MAAAEDALAAPEDQQDFDVAWSNGLSSKAFAENVAETLFKKGYCMIQMEDDFADPAVPKEVMHASRARTDWTVPKPEFETAFLGYGSKSKVVWLDALPPPSGQDAEKDPLLHYRQCVWTLSVILLPTVRDALGFKPGAQLSGTLLRMPMGRWEEEQLGQEELSEEEVRKGWVEKHLDFVQRRRLCMMYMIDNSGGTVELYPRPELNEQPIALPVTKGKLLVFRHDLMTYAYMARGASDLILQSWFMEEPQQLSLATVEGDQESFEAIFGGPPQPPKDQVHVMSGHGRTPGRAYKLERIWPMLASSTDCFREIPFLRWDMSLYYTEDSGQFATSGKSVQKHAGLVQEEELIKFDNNFFNISKPAAYCIPPCQRLLMEVTYELLVFSGYSKKSLQGANLYTYIADIGLDWDQFKGFDMHEGWLESGGTGYSVSSASRLCYALGIVGPVTQVDTACSAALVGTNLLHSALSVRRDSAGPSAGMALGTLNILQPWPFIGLSAAGMIGRSGRSRTFDKSANGYAKGEGSSGIFLKTSADVEATQNRLAAYCGSYINQDGRSASLTAPNGPSQQACIRGSLRSGGIDPFQVSQTENHGTGTALGDPIEVGSIAGVWRKYAVALPISTHKTNTGHLEGNAGSMGLMKVLVCLVNSVFVSNNHLRELNPNMIEEGFPAFFPTEAGDIPSESAIMGLNAFGFGGTNSRAELWAPGRRSRTFREVVTRGLNGLRVDKLGPARRLLRISAGLLAAAALGSAAALAAVRTSPTALLGSRAGGQGSLLGAVAAWGNCSGLHENCWKKGCCQAGGGTCFAKDLGWAECQQNCAPGVHGEERREYQTAWSCLQVHTAVAGSTPPPTPAPAPCSWENQGCLESRCCQEPSLRCYLKDANWAQCMHECKPEKLGMSQEPGDKVPQPWSCAELRRARAPPAPAPPERDPASCASVAEDCRESGCCRDDFMGCYERDKGWAGCLRSCQAGLGWNCRLLGPARRGPSRSGRSLFCFALMLPFGNEVDLLKSQFDNQVGIFRCERHRVFSNQTLQLGTPGFGRQEATTALPGSLVCHPGGIYMTALNTEIFIRIWRGVLEDKQYLDADWTVKADPDAVFLPRRLREHVGRYLQLTSAESRHPVYLNNCKDGMHGPLEVASLGAMTAFRDGLDICERELRHEFGLYGEDVFFRHCMLILGVERFDDFALLYETVCDPFPKDPMPCTPMKVAYHPLKLPNKYMECLLQAESQDKANDAGVKLLQVGI